MPDRSSMSFRVSVDTGGTFTDVVVADKTGRLHIGKAATTPERAYTGLSASLDDVAETLKLDRQALLGQTSIFTYGTTRATNAIIERKVAKTALLVTEGFPEILVLKEGGASIPTSGTSIIQSLTFPAATPLRFPSASPPKAR